MGSWPNRDFSQWLVRDVEAARAANPNFLLVNRWYSKQIFQAQQGPNQRGVVLRQGNRRLYSASELLSEEDLPEQTWEDFTWDEIHHIYLSYREQYQWRYFDLVIVNVQQANPGPVARRRPPIRD